MDIKDREKLVDAFDHMVEHVKEAMDEAEEALAPTVDEMVHNAQVLAREVYALTQEEAESLAASLKRDMHKANETLNRQGKELGDWLSFDLTLVEDKFIEMISRAADKTWLDFRRFEAESREPNLYRSGEVCSAGTLSCKRCGNTIQLSRSQQIPRCPACGRRKFYRVTG